MACDLPVAVATELELATGSPVRSARSLAGGDIARAYRVELDDGARLFVKLHHDGARMFPAEARGLSWLREADAIRIPAVVAVGPEHAPFLALELVDAGPPAADHDERLGRELAALHRAGAPSFGFDADNFVGALPQDNRACIDWPTFYRERRLAPLVRRAADDGLLDRAMVSAFDDLFAVLPDRCGPPEPPARLHGDLWAGNAITDERGAPVLIDPAVYGGHREIDLAMMHLFGGFSSRCFAAYAEAHPLAPDSASRIPLYQLYPLLVHVNLFGAAYVGQLRSALRRVL
jgi:fructosamine-3-kinase